MDNNFLAWIGISLASISLILHIKNRKIALKSFWMSRDNYRSSGIDLQYVGTSPQSEGSIVKLVLFNPGSIAAVIKSLTVTQEVESKNPILRYFGTTDWVRLREAKWWPTDNEDCVKPKYFDDEFKNLYVEDYRVILVKIPGEVHFNRYKFHVKTNLGGYATITSIGESNSSFPYGFEQYYKEN